jgi:uncharacterized small protein (DUF1192 family)
MSTVSIYVDGESKTVGTAIQDQISNRAGELQTAEALLKMGFNWSGIQKLQPRIDWLNGEIDRLEKLRGKKDYQKKKTPR